jgi:hypothetical protein
MLIYSLLCSCRNNVSSFWLKLKQQWTIEEISIFSNSSHLEWRAELSDTILKWDYPWTISTKVGLIWFSGFRGEDLNVIFYQICPICIIGKNRLKEKFHRNLTAAILNGGQSCRTQFWKEPTRDHPCQVRFNLVQRFQRRFKCESLRRTTDGRTDGRMPSDGKKKCLWKINSNNKIWIWSIAWTWKKTPLKSIETTIDFVLFSTKCTFGIWFGFFDTWINIYILSVKCHATKWSDRVSEWFLFNANFSAISWQEHI